MNGFLTDLANHRNVPAALAGLTRLMIQRPSDDALTVLAFCKLPIKSGHLETFKAFLKFLMTHYTRVTARVHVTKPSATDAIVVWVRKALDASGPTKNPGLFDTAFTPALIRWLIAVPGSLKAKCSSLAVRFIAAKRESLKLIESYLPHLPDAALMMAMRGVNSFCGKSWARCWHSPIRARTLGLRAF